MATTTRRRKLLRVLQQHPSHEHPLQLLDLTNESIPPNCRLCFRRISRTAEAYTCKERCQTNFYYHRLCVEAPPQLDRHPLHPAHPLFLVHDRPYFRCDACCEDFHQDCSSFRCHECNFDLDIACSLSTLSDEGRHQGGKTPDRITLSLHPHQLTSFSQRHDFIENSDCYICKGGVKRDGYMCLRCPGEFLIHKECILYYADGTEATNIHHNHPLETFVEEDAGSRICARCESDKSGEFIGCETCRVFYHRNCLQVPGILRYPSHTPDLTLALFPDSDTERQCASCSMDLEDEIHYRCTFCEFFVHIECAMQVLAYYEQGMSAEIELSWHKHRLLLCHLTESASEVCFYCEDESIGPTYVCKEKDCRFLLHKRCLEIEPMINHPHHPDHPLTLCERDYDKLLYLCKACGRISDGLSFSCERCFVDLDVKCAARFPTHKHYLHEHNLQLFEKHRNLECNRCETINDSPIFRCAACNFNLHEECMELPQVMRNDKIHWHPLTLHETFVEDDTGEYYCEHCEKTRDPRLGVYVCGYCEISLPRIYHIHCVIPELGNVYAKKNNPFAAVKKLSERIADKKEEVRAIKDKLDEATREVDALVKQRNELLNKKTDVEFNRLRENYEFYAMFKT